MELTQLYYFRTVAEHENFTRAAEALHVTQSALSKSVSRLEEELGLRLFEREGNRISLNRFGRRFLEHVEGSVTSLNDGVRAVREMAGLEHGEVRIAFSRDVFIDHIVSDFLLDFPQASLSSYLMSPEQMRPALEGGEIDMAVTTVRPEGPNIMWQPVCRDSFAVMLSSEHPLAVKRKIYAEDLKNERFVILNVGYKADNVVRRICRQAGFEPSILYEGTSTDMPMLFLEKGLAVMLTPNSVTSGVTTMIRRNPGIASVPLDSDSPDAFKTVGIAFREGHYQSDACHEFYNRLIEFYNSAGEAIGKK